MRVCVCVCGRADLDVEQADELFDRDVSVSILVDLSHCLQHVLHLQLKPEVVQLPRGATVNTTASQQTTLPRARAFHSSAG